MLTAHTGMNISPGEYMHVMDDILLALDKNDIFQKRDFSHFMVFKRNDYFKINYLYKF